ncbi:MAG: haloacid dehalogenase-like hydrolase [Patescibacteria group bacterium]
MGKKSALYVDLDGTWHPWQMFDELIKMFVRLGIMPQIVLEMSRDQFLAYKNKRGKFSHFIDAAVSAYYKNDRLRGMRISDAKFAAQKVIEEKGLRVHLFTDRLSWAAYETGVWRTIISGSPREVVQAFANAQLITEVFATEHPCDDEVFLGGEPNVWASKKGEAVRVSAKRNNIDLQRSVAVGDSLSDSGMFELVGYPVCFNPERALLKRAKENRWPVVFEKKDVIAAFVPNEDGLLVEADFSDILPSRLAKRLERLLAIVAR